MTGVVIVRMYLFGFAGKADWTPRRGPAAMLVAAGTTAARAACGSPPALSSAS
ncbi:MAG: hypothetical protein ACHQRJ_12530 [Alphaproteobacteria bacterium]